MKTAISIPDETFERASRRARALGMSRSEFFATAAVRYLDELEAHSLTQEIDQAVTALAGYDAIAEDVTAMGRRVLDATPEW